MTKEEKEIKHIQLLATISDFIRRNNYSPTVRELCEITKTASTSTIHLRLNWLESEGMITMVKGKPRTICINENVCHIEEG